jgi:hypothetical protein
MPAPDSTATAISIEDERSARSSPQPPTACRNRWVIAAALVVLSIHGALLLATLGDWRVTIDSAYHVSLARAYGEHGLVPWEHINFGPGGRPNLQGPLMYLVIGGLGRAMGGSGNDYVLANAIVAAAQWIAAMATAGLFALWMGGEWAMLIAVALLSGAGFAATSFAVGIPSGWLFILTPWAIYFFLNGRIRLAALLTAAAIYAHIGGYATAPLGIAVAAVLTRRWRDLFLVGVVVAFLTAPYTVHCLRYWEWLRDFHSHSALLFDPMLDALGIAGLISVLKRPQDNAFLVAWAGAPISWLFQDPGRFILQSGLVASVLAGIWIAPWLSAISARRRAACAAVMVAIATLCPLGVPALGAEAAWAAGIGYPRPVNWHNADTLARVIQRNGLADDLVADYMPALCPAIAVYAPVTCEKGHWVEVQPRIDPADAISAGRKVYVLPLSANDPALAATVRRRWVRVWGGTSDSTVATLTAPAPLGDATAVAGRIVEAQAGWLSEHAVNNSFGHADWSLLLSSPALAPWQARLIGQRERAGRIELALIVYAYALEPSHPKQAAAIRRAACGFGVIASFLGDDLALDYESSADTANLRRALGRLALAAQSLVARSGSPAAQIAARSAFAQELDQTLPAYLVMSGTTFAERPGSDNLPWLAAIRKLP